MSQIARIGRLFVGERRSPSTKSRALSVERGRGVAREVALFSPKFLNIERCLFESRLWILEAVRSTGDLGLLTMENHELFSIRSAPNRQEQNRQTAKPPNRQETSNIFKW